MVLLLASPARAATFVVNSAADTSDAAPGDATCDTGTGACTLRAAIEEANANAGADAIHFAIGTGAQTIAFPGALPPITEAVTIDGTTQPGYAGMPLITLDGAMASDGLRITGNGSIVRALALTQFLEGISIDGGSNNVITGNAIYGNASHGIAVYEGSNSSFPEFTALTPDQTLVVPSIDFTDGCGSFRHSAGSIILDTAGRAFNENFGMRLTATLSIPMAGTYTFAFDNLDDHGRLLVDGVEVLNNTSAPPVTSNSIALTAG
ncbi:MAG TPA: CSLREA domain-containing protein, partial [Thermoanaerobaculia bacterium]|nr:CSLREA domain-containing protein [Thermoanaerobaculia bacterium]